MMFDLPARLLVAYGLIALMVLAVVSLAVWTVRNSRPRRDARARTRLNDQYRKRDLMAAADQTATKR